MNKYEIMFIVKPDVEEDARNQLIENFKNILSNGEGSVDNVNEWGLRDFAYEIKDYTKGYYVVVDTTTTPANIAEFERLSRINANVLRHLTLRRD
ncbi:MAG: 30S ribosomal protein S6 [Coprobacillus cateniformis]|uniref:Small ribosomal subunit protein bS6 n=1 Tax=Longibaculum muris TaxID=1796628 RepID=A0A4R3YQF7_9FIRM|nr:30S ribosomal protein S6 [Longibaculum muris]KXU51770.1 ribosomal protein S6 [Candidatus Stoquefichus sp. KLE1796]MBS5111814.1 30S ribosomal protein S6 [Coprobacillus cateniformis]MBS5371233.1 30S ribosomal protein S6 [Coprobacillus cateniformis]MCR1888882.1 30S ribosomal protein S6 [Longibaculum muris]MED9811261.1 30S ribosomal protein S6 [Longibaculum muris]